MAFLPNNNNYRSNNNMFNTQSFEPLNNFPFIQPMTPIANNQIMTNPILLAQNVPTTNLKRSKSFFVPMTYGNNMLGNSPNNIYLNQANIYLDQNLNYRMPGNNVYSTKTLKRIPLYSNLTARKGIGDANYLGEKAYYNRNTEVVPPIRFEGYPHNLYSSSLKPNNYMFRIRRSQKELEEIRRERNLKINTMLEEMCIYGSGAKERIILDKAKNPGKYIEKEIALEKEKEDPELFALGLVASILEQNNIVTAIKNDKYVEKQTMNVEISQKEKDEKEAKLNMQFLSNGLIGKKKYDLYFAMDENIATQIMYVPEQREIFKDRIKEKVHKDLKVPKDEMVVTIPSINHAQLVFQKDEFDYLDKEDLKRSFTNDPNYPELATLIEIKDSLLMSGCILSKDQLDKEGDKKKNEWPIGQTRGGEKYNSPEGWIGIGLKVYDKYDDYRWLSMYNIEGEWPVAYHGIGQEMDPSTVIRITGDIYKTGFKVGHRQLHKNCDDYYNKGHMVGEGVYCTPLINIAEQYAGISEFKGKKYKTVMMCRVNPKKRRHCYTCEDSEKYQYWVVNGTTDEIRPYRILYKQVEEPLNKAEK